MAFSWRPSVTSTVSSLGAFAGISIGSVEIFSSPRYERVSTFSGTVRPARGRMSSSHTRSMLTERGVSLALTVTSRPSTVTSAMLFASIMVSGPATAAEAPRIGFSVANTSSRVRSPWPLRRARLFTEIVAAPYWRSNEPSVLNIET